MLARFEKSIGDVVPSERWRDAAGVGGCSIAYLLFHITYHEDLSVNAVLRGEETAMARWREPLGAAGLAAHAGLGEAEDVTLTTALDLGALVGYARAVHEMAQRWIETADLRGLDAVPTSGMVLEAAGVGESEVPWLHAMWAGKPGSFFVQWEAIGHRVNHLGEMVSVRNRLGLSPFS